MISFAVSTRCVVCVASDETQYDIAVARPAARAIQSQLPEAVANAVIEFITGPLLENPQRAGKPLRGELAGILSARRGTYRVLYRIDEDESLVTILRVGHRGDIYR